MNQTDLQQTVMTAYRHQFGTAPALVAYAPGRVNLIGEHTDYNGGFVLPAAIDFGTAVAAGRRDDQRVRVVALDFGQETDEFESGVDIPFNSELMWSNYVRGVVQVLRAAGHRVDGVDLVISGDVPQGAGLSSSASLEMALIEALRTLFDLAIDTKAMALLGQAAENRFVGINCGVMDQMISANGQKDHALLIDCHSNDFEQIPVPADLRILIVNSNRQRGLVDSAYNERRAQCEAAAGSFGVALLRQVNEADFARHQDRLEPLVRKRARHVITENERTLLATEAFRQGDMATLGRLMAASHTSMREDFEITVPEIDYLVTLLQGVTGDAGGARMTGGGFGGCVVAVMPQALIPAAIEAVEANYETKTGLMADVYPCTPSAGASHTRL